MSGWWQLLIASAGALLLWAAFMPNSQKPTTSTPSTTNSAPSLADELRDTGELSIQIPALPRPTFAEIHRKFDWISERDGIWDSSPTGPVTLRLGTVLRPGDMGRIDGAQYEGRITHHLNELLGYQHLEWLVIHQDEFPTLMALVGQIYVDGPAFVVALQNKRGVQIARYVPCLEKGFGKDGDRWSLGWRYLRDFRDVGRIAFSGK